MSKEVINLIESPRTQLRSDILGISRLGIVALYFLVLQGLVGMVLGFLASLGAADVERGSLPDAFRTVSIGALLSGSSILAPRWVGLLVAAVWSAFAVVGLLAGAVFLTGVCAVDAATLIVLLRSRRPIHVGEAAG
jgi:hypothetical protein